MVAWQTLKTYPTLVDALREVERCHALIRELLPFMLMDANDGARLVPPAGHDDDCPDCDWHREALGWQSRIAAGEFDQFGIDKTQTPPAMRAD